MSWQGDIQRHYQSKRWHEQNQMYLKGIKDGRRGYAKEHRGWCIKVGDKYLSKNYVSVWDRKTATTTFKKFPLTHRGAAWKMHLTDEGKHHAMYWLERVKKLHPSARIVHLFIKRKLPPTKLKRFDNIIKIG